MSELLLAVRDLRITAQLSAGARSITTGIDLDLHAGETLGVVGESGSGKSMTARAIVGLLPGGVRASGAVRYRGDELLPASERALTRVRGAEIALIMQDPFTMLNPLMRCGDQIAEMLRDARGRALRRQARRAEAVRRLAEVGIHDDRVADARPFELSGGMRQRVAIAAALARDPRILIADEPSTALDVTTQREILQRIKELQASRGMGLILITHDLRLAYSMCDRIAVLYAGTVVEHGAAPAMETRPRHPYTLGLLLSEPPPDRRLSELLVIEGSVPGADDVADRCVFADRCAWSRPECVSARPKLAEVVPSQHSACIREHEIAPDMSALRAEAMARAHTDLAGLRAEPIVVVRDLRKDFGDGRGSRRVAALDGVSIEIGMGESVGLVGESGAGKSTLGRCLVGLEQPTGGMLRIGDVEFSSYAALPPRQRRLLHRTVQMVFQDPYSTLNPVRTIGATLREALTVRDPDIPNASARVGELLERVGLPSAYAGRKPVALSGGERQRVAIARALAMEPRVIVCDEAVSALDVSVQAQILNLLASLRRDIGISYLFITHDLAVVRQVAQRVYVLRGGAIVESGAVDDVLDRPRHAYTRALVDAVPRADGAWLDGTHLEPAARRWSPRSFSEDMT